ncbi:hypothetical protein ABZT27_31340 [Streptomyces sp. NPDC005389]|uniref:hypothetical protein n=1 Tax=Streptomyces sp. NPDC005389 TaxID=3157040 RepID=UPI0033B983C3
MAGPTVAVDQRAGTNGVGRQGQQFGRLQRVEHGHRAPPPSGRHFRRPATC